MLLFSMTRFFKFLPEEQRLAFSGRPEQEGLMSSMRSDPLRLRLDPVSYETLRLQVLRRDGWRCQFRGSTLDADARHLQSNRNGGPDAESTDPEAGARRRSVLTAADPNSFRPPLSVVSAEVALCR